MSNFCVSCLDCLAKNGRDARPPSTRSSTTAEWCDEVGSNAARARHRQAYSPLGDSTRALISGDLERRGAAHNKRPRVQVALRWIRQHGVAVTTKSTNAAHLAQDLDIFEGGG